MKTIKQIFLFIVLIIFAANLSSCLKEEEKRTWEMEQEEIQNYLEGLISEGHDIDTTNLGVYYVSIEEGEGNFPQHGDTLTIGYAGYFIDGTLFDSSELNSEDGTYIFRFLEDPMIAGFEDGLRIMNKGAKIQMIVPSDLAYGESGSAVIPNYATLVFVVRLIDIKPYIETE